MKPINSRDLQRAYLNFIFYFVGLLIFSVVVVYFFFLTSNREVAMLNNRVKESEKLISVRNDINNNFDIILLRLSQLSQYTKINSTELNNQSVLLNDIQESNLKIQALLQQNTLPLKSFDLYKKLSDNISTVASIKDSLFTTRYQIESLRRQLQNCNRTNNTAVNTLRNLRR
ncbi:type VI secretion system TssO [Mucilaginibacter lacusdianchii]|uniref:type VI secretion system TssO n=1 Tax=Mucilaginibacter lacusdianchii TaxID=2684211 RepID=UPI00131CBBFA|nr:type VI secretion system TssO [Mucilaginibacter sp. JXJ CY 39]